MFDRGISKATQATLRLVGQLDWVKKYYLAGGTATALRCGHRLSFDLDFFSQKPVGSEIIRLDLRKLGKLVVSQNEPGTFNGSLNGTKLGFFIYPYPLLDKSEAYEGVSVASMTDLGCMKLDVIGSRGSKRDFIDLFVICREYALERLVKILSEKYGQEIAMTHILRSLAYFDDAEGEEMPIMKDKSIQWTEVKRFFEAEALKIGRNLGLN